MERGENNATKRVTAEKLHKNMTIKHFILVPLSGHQPGKAHTFVEEGRFPDMGEDFALLCVFHC